jgi:iron(III) transport system substrate-binding protein
MECDVNRRINRLGLLLVLLLLMACSGPPQTGAPAAQSSAPAAAGGEVPAWQAEWDRTVAAAKAEGEVIVWTGQPGDDFRQVLKDEFEKAYPGIRVSLFQAPSTTERDSRFLAERESGVAKVDVMTSGSGSANSRLKPIGALRDLRPYLILPEVTDPSKWFDNRFLWADPEEMYVAQPEARVSYALAVNSAVPVSELKSWWDLLNPKYKDKIVMTDPRQSGAGFSRSEFFFFTPELGTAFTSRYYGETGITFGSDTRQNLEWVVSGRMLLNVSPDERQVALAQEAGLPFQIVPSLSVTPDGSKAGNSFSGGATAIFLPDTEILHPNAAKVYVNWYLSQKGQQLLADQLVVPSLRTDVTKSKIAPALLPQLGTSYMHMERFSDPEQAAATREDVNRALPR